MKLTPLILLILLSSCSKQVLPPENVIIEPPFAVSKDLPTIEEILSGILTPDVPEGFPAFVLAAAEGTIIEVTDTSVLIEHRIDDAFFYTQYSKIKPRNLKNGERVRVGSLVGTYSDKFCFEVLSLESYSQLSNNLRPQILSIDYIEARLSSFFKKKNHRPRFSHQKKDLRPLSLEIMSLQFRKFKIAILNPCIDPEKLSMVRPVEKLIKDFTLYNVDTLHYKEERPLDNYDFIVITGQSTPWEDYDLEDFSKVRDIVVQGSRPVLGICGGHQLISLLEGGSVDLIKPESCDKSQGYGGCFKVKGLVDVEVDSEDSLFTGYETSTSFYASHCEEVTFLPDNYHITASTGFSPIYAFKKNDAPVYGIQFHPELPANNNKDGRNVLFNFLLLAHSQ